jgi:hypothetical protein
MHPRLTRPVQPTPKDGAAERQAFVRHGTPGGIRRAKAAVDQKRILTSCHINRRKVRSPCRSVRQIEASRHPETFSFLSRFSP